MKKQLYIGLFGGSFDPVHNGHIELAKAARAELKLDKVVFIPAKMPPHKLDKKLSPAKSRVQLLRLALKQYKYFTISSYELNRDCCTYTWQTVAHFKDLFKGSRLFFIIGADSLVELKTWKKIKTLVKMITFVAAKRHGVRVPSGTPFASLVEMLKGRIQPVSSSRIRKLAAAGRSLKGLVPGQVERTIRENRLYK